MSATETVCEPAKTETSVSPTLPKRSVSLRIALLLACAFVEAAVISVLFVLPPELDRSVAPIDYLRDALHAAVLSFATFCLIIWPTRRDLLVRWHAATREASVGSAIAVNGGLFLVAAAATIGISIVAKTAPDMFWRTIAPYLVLLGLLGVSLARIFAPLPFWRELIARSWVPMLFAVFLGLMVLGMSEMAKGGWSNLAGVTLYSAAWILRALGNTVIADPVTKDLGVNDFIVTVGGDCSGYEGMALVAAFLVIYMLVFRHELAFPNVLLLFPIGILTIWVFNILRIVALMSIGAYVSPFWAVSGFHSQAGWVAFLLVTVGILVAGYKVPFFRSAARDPALAPPSDTPAHDATSGSALAWLAPFMALMSASIVASAFAPNEHWLYFLRVLAVAAVLWTFRSFYLNLVTPVSALAVVAGLVVGAAWIATDPDPAGNEALRQWFAGLPASVITGWLIIRALGSVVFVPIAEELAFRGYLQNAVASLRIAALSPAVLGIVAIVVSATLFGLIHQRWIAGMLAGAVYGFLAYRSGRVADAVAAHAASNAIIIAWAYASAQWSLI